MSEHRGKNITAGLADKSFNHWSLLSIDGGESSLEESWRSYTTELPRSWSAPRGSPHFLEALFGSKSRARALAYLTAGRGNEEHLTGLARKAGTTAPTLRKSLAPLLAVGILRQRMEGNRLYLAVNPDHPAYPGIVRLIKAAVSEARKKRDNAPLASGTVAESS